MFQLAVNDPKLDVDYSVILVKSTLQSYSVVCGLWPATGGLTTDVVIKEGLHAYASVYTAPFQDCVKIPVNFRSSLVKGFLYLFDGTHFVQQEEVPSYTYALCNGKQPPLTPLTCGTCQDITVAGVAATPPVCVQSLPAKHTTYFSANNRFRLGVGKFRGFCEPQPGLLLSTSLIKGSQGRRVELGQLTLGPFASVDFSEGKPRWTASYQPETGSFQVAPA
jgi:hypothetical protein